MPKQYHSIPDEKRLRVLLDLTNIAADEVGMTSGSYMELFDTTVREQGARPHLRGIVKIRLSHTGAYQYVYRKYRGVTFVDNSEIVVSFSTVQEIRGGNKKEIKGYDVELESAGRVMGRLKFYWYHPNDSTRSSFKLGMVGLLLALIAFFA